VLLAWREVVMSVMVSRPVGLIGSGDHACPSFAAHPHVATADPRYADALLTMTPLYDPAGSRVAGDIDLSNTRAWQSALTAIAGRVDEVRLDLADLGFIDVQGVRALARTAAGMAAGHRLVIDSAPPELLRILRLSGWGHIANLVLEAR
jgi:anti-anti-sigma factor